jgi:hypothetical protein
MAVDPAPLVARPASAESRWPDADLWHDFKDSAPDSEADALITPPTAEDMRATLAVLAARHGRPVIGRMVADHFGVSERTGRRYLTVTA